MDLLKLSISQVLDGYRKKTFSPSELVGSYLRRVSELNPKLNALLQTKPDQNLATAKALDGKLSEMEKLPLFGVPVAIKDNFLVKDWQATAGSKILGNYVSPYTCTVVERLEQAGAVIIGKANCDEFAMGSSNENSAYGPVKNPWDLACVPGGSSGGSAAAVAAGFAPASLGSDTGGSIRQPASLCGIVGLRPSYGRVSRYGIIAYSSSLDQVGPFGKDVWDSARVLEVIAGQDPKDSTSSSSAVPRYTDLLKSASLKGVKIGVARDWLKGANEEVVTAYQKALSEMEKAGAVLKDIELPNVKYSVSTYYLIAPSEASSNLARYDGVHYGHRSKDIHSFDDVYQNSRGEGFGKEVKLRIMLGTYALSAGYYDAYYLKANQVRRLIQQDFENVYKSVDIIATPTSPETAFKIGEKSADPLKMYLSDIYTIPVNLAGLAGISVPCGLDKKNLPIGLQFISKPFDESRLLSTAFAYEQVRGNFPQPPFKGL